MVKLRRCRIGRSIVRSHYNTSFGAAGESGIPEKALKGRAISNHAKYACLVSN